MKLQGRKFFGMLLGVVVNTAIIISGYILAPESIDNAVLIFAMGITGTLITAFIGGNVWATWAKSKYFRSELKDEK